MNILHISPNYNYVCGRSKYVYSLLKCSVDNGIKVTVATNGGDALERINNLGVGILKLPLNNYSKIIYSIRLIKTFIEENNIDIVHTHHRYAEVLSNILRNQLKHKKCIKTITTGHSILKGNYHIEFKSNKIIAVSNIVRDMLVNKFKVSPQKIELINNFILDEEILSTRIERNKEIKKIDNIELLSVGRFHSDKNFELLFKAINTVNNKNIHLNLIGSGNLLKSYCKIIDKYNLNITIITTQKNLIDYYNIADICILPSIIDPFPTFMLEAGYYQKAFIGSNIAGINELIIDGYNGLLFKTGDVHNLSDKIREFINSPKLMNNCADNLYLDVKNKFTHRKIFPKIHNLYSNILEK